MAVPRPEGEVETIQLWIEKELEYVWKDKLNIDAAIADLKAYDLHSTEGLWGRLLGSYWNRALWFYEQDPDTTQIEVIRALGKEAGAAFGLVTVLEMFSGHSQSAATALASEVVGDAVNGAINQGSYTDPKYFPDLVHDATPMHERLVGAEAALRDWRSEGDVESLETAAYEAKFALADSTGEFRAFALQEDGNLLLPVPGFSSTDKTPVWG